ncbi:PQQ-dependent sugar dehydrogenase [Leucothrix arctica]|uniref:Dehydrogenase n=1 Tax=Leucothrix arctica TaxID=1481894 RepID=A0A317CI28_9GAMM|nr:PQQ-dependent sugar dehydrogenase [Leucothrix arctica]PWQ95952.1 dehydrogenase [Leucothrix arctica]
MSKVAVFIIFCCSIILVLFSLTRQSTEESKPVIEEAKLVTEEPKQVIEAPKQAIDESRIGYTTLAELSGVPWGLAQLDNDTFIYTLRKGESGLVDKTTGEVTPLTGLPSIASVGQGGLLDVAVPKDYTAGQWIYFTYSKMSDGLAVTTLARTRLDGTQFVDWTDLFVSNSGTDKGQHFGSRIAFDDQGFVYFGIGDRGVRENAQNLENDAGSIIRMKRDGTLRETYSYGHRNPQGLTFDSKTQRLWEAEHGPRGGDEINIIEQGKNYGWPVISYGKEYWGPIAVGEGTEKEGVEQPVKVYIPSIAPSSLVVYRGDVFPDWEGDLLLGALVLTHINHIKLDESGKPVKETRLLESLGERIRALLVATDGHVYFSTDSGKIMRLLPDQ